MAAERGIPVVGNGDILTHYEARERVSPLGGALADAGPGRADQAVDLPGDAGRSRPGSRRRSERLGVLWRFVELLREHFGVDERGVKRAMRFLPWHLGFFCRYRPLPEEAFAEQARAHPLLQSRLDAGPFASPLERLLTDARPEVHRELATLLLAATDRQEALEGAKRLADATPPGEPGGLPELSMKDVAG